MSLASESAEEEDTRLSRRETERGVPHSLRRRRKIVAALKLPRPESVETEIERLDSESAEETETRLSKANDIAYTNSA